MIRLWLLFSTLIFFNLSFMVIREFLSSFDSYIRFSNLSSIASASPVLISTTSTSLLLASSSSYLSLSISEASSFRSPHSFLKYSATKAWTVEVAIDWKFQLNVVYMVKKRLSNGWIKNWLNKKLETLKKELQCKISKLLK